MKNYKWEVLVIKYKPNYMITATGLVNYMMSRTSLSKSVKYFKCLAIGGEGITPNSENRINNWLNTNGNSLNLRKGYGMCECCGAVTNTELNCNPIGCAGIPTPHVSVSAFDLVTGEELKYGQRGEIRVLTPCRMSGYYNNLEETKKYFHTDIKGNVWACTGDMGYVTKDGCVYIIGRINDSYINNQNEVVYLFDIDRAVLDIPQVKQCKTVVSQIDGKTVHVCHTVLEDSYDKYMIVRTIIEHCSKVLPYSYQPYYFKFYDSLPVSLSGKLNIQEMGKNTNDLFDCRTLAVSR